MEPKRPHPSPGEVLLKVHLFLSMLSYYLFVCKGTTKNISPIQSHKAALSKGKVTKEGTFINVYYFYLPNSFAVSRKRALSIMDKETEEETSPHPRKIKKTSCI